MATLPPGSPHQNSNNDPSEDYKYEGPKGIGKEGIHALIMRRPAFDGYAHLARLFSLGAANADP
jgi:hypothetical protein